MEQFEQFSEAEVVARILTGETELFEIIVKRFNPYLYKVGRSYNFNHEDTQDLMQETFIDAYNGLGQFEGRSKFKTWIIRIMLNNCFRKKNKASFKNEIVQEVTDHSEPMFAAAGSDTDFVVRKRELRFIIEDALSKIPFHYRMVFSLREINGINVSETAALLKITETNVKVRLNRAKAMLRLHIEKTYRADELFEFNLIYCDGIVENVMREINQQILLRCDMRE